MNQKITRTSSPPVNKFWDGYVTIRLSRVHNPIAFRIKESWESEKGKHMKRVFMWTNMPFSSRSAQTIKDLQEFATWLQEGVEK